MKVYLIILIIALIGLIKLWVIKSVERRRGLSPWILRMRKKMDFFVLSFFKKIYHLKMIIKGSTVTKVKTFLHSGSRVVLKKTYSGLSHVNNKISEKLYSTEKGETSSHLKNLKAHKDEFKRDSF